MILLLGASGYIGQAFIKELQSRARCDFRTVSRRDIDYTNPRRMIEMLSSCRPEAVINCAAFIPGGAVDNCEDFKAETISTNLVFPALLAQACRVTCSVLIHVSTGCLFNGDYSGRGFSEAESPQLSFRTNCGVYVGSKELAEYHVSITHPAHYICRIRLPFDQYDHPRNYISKLMNYPKAVRATNSISHRADFVRAVLDLHSIGAPFGTYNMTNPGSVDSAWIAEQIKTYLGWRKFEWWDEKEFLEKVARTPKSNCKLDVSKLLSTGVKMRPVEEAVIDSLKNWVALPKA